jgi:hypothetical protein
MKKVIKLIGILAIFAIVASLLSCAYVSHKGNAAFESIKMGDSKAQVIGRFGLAYVAKPAGVSYPRYASQGCKSPCTERLWFPNAMSLDIEAWSVDFDKHDQVIDKYHWSSP